MAAEQVRHWWSSRLILMPRSRQELIENMDKFSDWDNPAYSNIQRFKQIDSAIEVHEMVSAA